MIQASAIRLDPRGEQFAPKRATYTIANAVIHGIYRVMEKACSKCSFSGKVAQKQGPGVLTLPVPKGGLYGSLRRILDGDLNKIGVAL